MKSKMKFLAALVPLVLSAPSPKASGREMTGLSVVSIEALKATINNPLEPTKSFKISNESNESLFWDLCRETAGCFSPTELEDFSSDDLRAKQNDDQISATTMWWGYQIFVPSKLLGDVGAIAGLAGAVAGLVPPPAGPALAIYVAAQATTMHFMNKDGKGVLLGGTWLSPGAIIPRSGSDFY